MRQVAERRRMPMGSPTGMAVLVLALVGAITAAAVLLWNVDRDALEWIVQEDGSVEYLTALAYLAAAGACAVQAFKASSGRGWWALLALAFFFVAGEEVSWGQRILGYGTPEGLRKENVQDEFNLHNVEGLQQTNRSIGVLFFLGYFLLVPVLWRYWASVRSLVRRVRLPVPPLWVAPAVLLGIAVMAVPRLSGGEIWQLDEVGELDLSIAALLLGIAAGLRLLDDPLVRARVTQASGEARSARARR